MAIEINSVVYDGSPANPTNPFPPDADGYERTDAPTATTLVSASGKRNSVYQGSARRPQWKLKWTNANITTRSAVNAAAALTTTFPFKDQFGTTWTVQREESDTYTEATSATIRGGVSLYNLSLSFHLAT